MSSTAPNGCALDAASSDLVGSTRSSERDAPVVIVCNNVSNNCLGRALLLAELVPKSLEARVVGVQLGKELWAPGAGFRRPVRALPIRSAAEYPAAARWLAKELDGARVVVSKPLYSSLGLALRAGVARERLLLDVDDWELGLHQGKGFLQNLINFVNPKRDNSYWSVAWMDRKIARCPRRLVSNSWLERRYGGAVLPHVRDVDFLAPSAVDGAAVRAELGMDGRFWVGFVGTVRPHKGNLELIDAIARAGDDVGLFLAGVDERNEFARRVVERARTELGEARVRAIPFFPFDELPKWMSAPDAICLPGNRSSASVGQIPAKLFDAMAMAKPVIAADLNDAGEILDGAGEIVPPGDVDGIVAAIRRLRDDPERCRELGQRARQRVSEHFSYEAGRKILMQALDELPVFRRASA